MKLFPAGLVLLFSTVGLAQPTLKNSLDSFFRRQDPAMPGFVLSIEKNGKTLYRNAAGIADLDTRMPLGPLSNFRMASVTKQFTAMGILLLEKRGALSLDDPIGRWLPELPGSIGKQVHIRHLLTHTSGLLDYESLIRGSQTEQVLDADVLRLLAIHDSTYFVPGSRFRYSNSGFCLLALIIERASRESFGDYVQKNIFLPLHMDSSTIYSPGGHIPYRVMGYARDTAGNIFPSDQSVTSATQGDGGLYTSLADYAKWTSALEQDRLVRLADLIQRLRFPIAGMSNSYYAAGWFQFLGPPQLLFHSGSTCGFANFVIRVPSANLCVVYFSNIAENTSPFREIVGIIQNAGLADLSPVLPLHDLTQ